MSANEWEMGSEFDLRGVMRGGIEEPGSPPWARHRHIFTSCGRDALRVILNMGRNELGWRCLWIPDYYCPEVTRAAQGVLPIEYYRALPGRAALTPWTRQELGRRDVVLIVNTFGLQQAVTMPPNRAFAVIEDHTHDPFSAWAAESKADFALASLRKWLPVPDGGVAWSPLDMGLPAQLAVSASRQAASDSKLLGMLEKSLYLLGGALDRAEYRRRLEVGEGEMAAGEPSGMTVASRALLSLCPWHLWRTQRRANWQLLVDLLGGANLRVLSPESGDALPFSCVVETTSTEARENLRSFLIENGVFPAVLWRLTEGTQTEARQLSSRLLSIHCDQRYTLADMERLAPLVITGSQLRLL